MSYCGVKSNKHIWYRSGNGFLNFERGKRVVFINNIVRFADSETWKLLKISEADAPHINIYVPLNSFKTNMRGLYNHVQCAFKMFIYILPIA